MRFSFIDGLRGIAALMVMIFHFYSLIQKNTGTSLPPVLDFLCLHGHLGVQIFFVLSGFVITYSIRQAEYDYAFGARFFLRRSLRLDPPYWTAVILIVLLSVSSALLLKKDTIPFSGPTLAANLFYVQDFLGYERLLPVSWTLCIELQLYLFLVALLILLKKAPSYLAQALFAFLFFLSIGQNEPKWIPVHLDGLFLPYWYSFFIGCCLAWVLLKRMDQRVFFLYLVLMLPLLNNLEVLMTAATAFMIFLAGRLNTLTSWLSSPVFGYFGTRSYSLYLLHWPLGMKLIDISSRWLPELNGAWLFMLSMLLTCLGAEIFYRIIERPSLQLSHSIKTLEFQKS